MPPRFLTGWRYAALVSVGVGSLALTIYPIIIQPMMNPNPWKELSKRNREEANIRQEDIQPGNMKIWTDPFDREGKPGRK